jgi:LCP family protein required for cell wall assembly
MNKRNLTFSILLIAVMLLGVNGLPYASAQATAIPTNTPRATSTPIIEPSLTPTVTPIVVTATPTAEMAATSILTAQPGDPFFDRSVLLTPPPPANTPVPSGDDVLTILLLGSDTITRDAIARTDVIIVVAINRTANTVTMLHMPRDLWVHMPNIGMAKINTVMNTGEVTYGEGGGVRLVKEMLLYNFGINVNYYARVDFVGLQNLVVLLGGLNLSVDCAIQGHKLIDPQLPYNDPASWYLHTENIGYKLMGGYDVLWYVRSRGSSSDLDRGRRQMEVLRAMWRQARERGVFEQVTTLYPEVQRWVYTDLTIPDMLGIAPIALALDPTKIQRISLSTGVHFVEEYSPGDGEFIFIPNRQAWEDVVTNLYRPPSPNRLGGENPTVQIGAALALKGLDQVAADRLSWEGLTVTMTGTEGAVDREDTVIFDYTGGAKPQSLQTIVDALRIRTEVISQPDPNATVDFRVEMGRAYATSCFYAIPTTTE